VEAGGSFKDIFAKTAGGGSNAEKRHSAELVLKPGELLMVDDPEAVINRDGTFGQPGRRFTRSHALRTELYRVRSRLMVQLCCR